MVVTMDELQFEPEQKKTLNKRRPKNRKTKSVLIFDEAARKEYLLGFQKRKNERRKRAKEENEKRIKEERQELRRQARELVRKSDQHRVPEVDHLVDSTVFDLPNHTVTITDMSEVDLSGTGSLLQENNADSSTPFKEAHMGDGASSEKPTEGAADLKRKQKMMKHKLSKCGNPAKKFKNKVKKGGGGKGGKFNRKDKGKFSGGHAKHKAGPKSKKHRHK